MLKLSKCTFFGLPGFDKLELSDLSNLTILTGPNGSGKSTILLILKFLFEILAKCSLSDTLPSHESWHRFTRSIVTFTSTEPFSLAHFGGYFDKPVNIITFEIGCTESTFQLLQVSCGDRSIELQDTKTTDADLAKLESQVLATLAGIQDLENRLKLPVQRSNSKQVTTPTISASARDNLEKQIEEQGQLLSRTRDDIAARSTIHAKVSGSAANRVLQRGEVREFLQAIGLPTVHYVNPQNLYSEAIPRLISQLIKDKKGRSHANQRFIEEIERLKVLLEAKIEVSEEDGQESMHINGISHKKASSGTQTSLAFFALTRLGDPKLLTLWDEPENGLHPTRRTRMLDLMKDDGRQFVLATHAAEFAPVFSERDKVFRCIAEYRFPDDLQVRLAIERVADRRDAFLLLDALGVHPAKTLFTANVVIWIEGPSELLFYRRWLVFRLHAQGILEGFHYTFMQYGGALITYLSCADEPSFDSSFDLLSMCRHPIVLVDSDRRASASDTDPHAFLKAGAARVLDEMERLNLERAGAGLFRWTVGREIENYLPAQAIWHAVRTLWKSYPTYAPQLERKPLKLDPFIAYHESLERHFIDEGVVHTDDKGNISPEGRSRWGSTNKVEVVQSALQLPGLAESDLLLDCSSHLQEIENFIRVEFALLIEAGEIVDS